MESSGELIINEDEEKNANEESKSVCHVCNQKFPTFELEMHFLECQMQEETEDQNEPQTPDFPSTEAKCSEKQLFKCELCSQNFHSKFSLNRHSRAIHSGERPYKCKICLRSFAQSYVLKRHKNGNNCVPYQSSNESQSELQTSSSETKSETTQMSDLPYKCDLCPNKRFTNKWSLYKHGKIHSDAGERRYKCTICFKSFRFIKALDKHKPNCSKSKESKQTSEKQHKCRFCSQSFTSSELCKRHERIHKRKKSYICSICQKAISDKSNFKFHVKKCKQRYEEMEEKANTENALKMAFGTHKDSKVSKKTLEFKYVSKVKLGFEVPKAEVKHSSIKIEPLAVHVKEILEESIHDSDIEIKNEFDNIPSISNTFTLNDPKIE